MNEVDVRADNWHLTIPEIAIPNPNATLDESALFPLVPVQLRPKIVDEEIRKPHILHEEQKREIEMTVLKQEKKEKKQWDKAYEETFKRFDRQDQ